MSNSRIDNIKKLHSHVTEGRVKEVLNWHVSEQAEAEDKDLIGMVVYDYNNQKEFDLNGVHVVEGEIFLRTTESLKDCTGETLHAKLFNAIFGLNWRDVKAAMTVSGFARQNGEWKRASTTLNANTGKNYSDHIEDNARKMTDYEFDRVVKKSKEFLDNNKTIFQKLSPFMKATVDKVILPVLGINTALANQSPTVSSKNEPENKSELNSNTENLLENPLSIQNFSHVSINPSLPGSQPVDFEFVEKYTDAIFSGIKEGLIDLGTALLHPIDQVIYPMAAFIYDAVILSMGHLDYNAAFTSGLTATDLAVMQDIVTKNPEFYNEALTRMTERLHNVNTAKDEFVKASLDEQIKILSSLGTTVLVPGYFMRAAKALVTLPKNLYKFDLYFKPSEFPLLYDKDDLIMRFMRVTPHDIKLITNETKLIYVILKNGELIIAPREVAASTLLFGLKPLTIHHHYLANLQSIVGAGEVIVEKGKIRSMNNFSGHYQPTGDQLQKLTFKTFTRHQHDLSSMRYEDFIYYADDLLPLDKKLANRKIKTDNNISAGIILTTLNKTENKSGDDDISLNPHSDKNLLAEVNKKIAEKENQEKINSLMDAGRADNKTGKYSEAIAIFNEVIQRKPDHALAHHELGYAYDMQKDYEKAIKSYHEAIRFNPKLAMSHHNLGTIHFKAGDRDKAIKNYNEAISLDPTFANTYLERSKAYLPDKLIEAKQDFETALKLNPNGDKNLLTEVNKKIAEKENQEKINALPLLELLEEAKKGNAVAFQHLEKLANATPSNSWALNNLGVYYDNAGNFDKALDCFRRSGRCFSAQK